MTGLPLRPGFNLQGVIKYREANELCEYVQVYRDGRIEAVVDSIRRDRGELGSVIYGQAVYERISGSVPRFLGGLRHLGVQGPYAILVSLLGVQKARLVPRLGLAGLEEVRAFHRDEVPIVLPEVVINEYATEEESVRQLRPIFDALWNGAGLPSCEFFEDDEA